MRIDREVDREVDAEIQKERLWQVSLPRERIHV